MTPNEIQNISDVVIILNLRKICCPVNTSEIIAFQKKNHIEDQVFNLTSKYYSKGIS